MLHLLFDIDESIVKQEELRMIRYGGQIVAFMIVACFAVRCPPAGAQETKLNTFETAGLGH